MRHGVLHTRPASPEARAPLAVSAGMAGTAPALAAARVAGGTVSVRFLAARRPSSPRPAKGRSRRTQAPTGAPATSTGGRDCSAGAWHVIVPACAVRAPHGVVASVGALIEGVSARPMAARTAILPVCSVRASYGVVVSVGPLVEGGSARPVGVPRATAPARSARTPHGTRVLAGALRAGRPARHAQALRATAPGWPAGGPRGVREAGGALCGGASTRPAGAPLTGPPRPAGPPSMTRAPAPSRAAGAPPPRIPPLATRGPELPGCASRTCFPERSAPESISPLGDDGQPSAPVTRTRGVERENRPTRKGVP